MVMASFSGAVSSLLLVCIVKTTICNFFAARDHIFKTTTKSTLMTLWRRIELWEVSFSPSRNA